MISIASSLGRGGGVGSKESDKEAEKQQVESSWQAE